jgi:hypothetical protein
MRSINLYFLYFEKIYLDFLVKLMKSLNIYKFEAKSLDNNNPKKWNLKVLIF